VPISGRLRESKGAYSREGGDGEDGEDVESICSFNFCFVRMDTSIFECTREKLWTALVTRFKQCALSIAKMCTAFCDLLCKGWSVIPLNFYACRQYISKYFCRILCEMLNIKGITRGSSYRGLVRTLHVEAYACFDIRIGFCGESRMIILSPGRVLHALQQLVACSHI
jgi:hypothetical protein